MRGYSFIVGHGTPDRWQMHQCSPLGALYKTAGDFKGIRIETAGFITSVPKFNYSSALSIKEMMVTSSWG